MAALLNRFHDFIINSIHYSFRLAAQPTLICQPFEFQIVLLRTYSDSSLIKYVRY